ncbi:MAG: phosphatidate cytidylyltransferase [Planctomycetes bacterium]|nr:phosphatidate cytidylyltransferase [Planctomycetota bacterium]MBL7106398.1 phosphatidate cytidylyltransferase [Phycisphaerae bacterium]
MLKYRLIFGTLLAGFFIFIVIFGGWLDGSLTASTTDDKPLQGTILAILLALLTIPAQMELAKLAKTKNIRIFLPVTIPASILFALSWYILQFLPISGGNYTNSIAAGCLFALFIYQYKRFGTDGVLVNCGASVFSVIYLGVLSSFVLAVYLEFGLWHLLMAVFTIKMSDIGAYTIGKIFGKHKFSPKISPKKTWEGMAGAVGAASLTAVAFGQICDIMDWKLAVAFGVCFAFLGQLGDLAESMIKRDAESKDSSTSIPGFGGILDVIDSPLAAAVCAYWFFMLTA